MNKSTYQIRHAVESDLSEIYRIYDHARQFMCQTGNQDQWMGGYPGADVIQEDLRKNQLYVCTANNSIAAVFCFFIGIDPTYLKIYDGSWLNEDAYGVIHRIAVSVQGKKISSICFDYALSQCPNLKIDTHRDNVPMQHALLKNGFSRCGTIYLPNGDVRIAFQKSL